MKTLTVRVRSLCLMALLAVGPAGLVNAGHHTPDFWIEGRSTGGGLDVLQKVTGCKSDRTLEKAKVILKRNRSWSLKIGRERFTGKRYRATNGGSRTVLKLSKASRKRFANRLMKRWAEKQCNGKTVRIASPDQVHLSIKLNRKGTRVTGNLRVRVARRDGSGYVTYTGELKGGFKPG